MGAQDLENLKKLYEGLKNGEILRNVSNVSADPDLINKIFVGVVAVGFVSGFYGMFFSLLGVGKKKEHDIDGTDIRTIHKFVAKGYMPEEKTR